MPIDIDEEFYSFSKVIEIPNFQKKIEKTSKVNRKKFFCALVNIFFW